MNLSDAELKKIADKAVDKWLEEELKKDVVSTKDMLAIAIGVTIGSAICYFAQNARLKRKVTELGK